MSYEVANEKKNLGQFASNNGFAQLRRAAGSRAALTKFLDEGITTDVKQVVAELADIEKEIGGDVGNTAATLRQLIEKEDVAVILDGTEQEAGE